MSKSPKVRSVKLDELFVKVGEINSLAGNYMSPSHGTLMHQLQIIGSEVEELQAGFAARDAHEIRDGIADVLFTVAGLYSRMGFAVPLHWNAEPEPEALMPEHRREYAQQCCALIERAQTTMETLATLHFSTVYTAIAAVAQQLAEDALQLASICGFDALADLQAVIDSNMTKFDRVDDDASKTREKYSAIGVSVYQIDKPAGRDEPPYIITFSSVDQTGDDNKKYPKGKWLKSINFQEPVFNAATMIDLA